MRKHQSAAVIVMAASIGTWILASEYWLGAAPGASLIDALVWGAEREVDRTAYAAPLRVEIDAHHRRFQAYRSQRPRPAGASGFDFMVYEAMVRYERRLVAVSTALEASELALAYVSELRPCYEWEGYHDCPEREATFAAAYQAAHSGGPFSQYLPLLEAHRWLCTAEAYDYEESPTEASRARRSYDTALAIARQSASRLVRTAAEELARRGSCFAGR